jgi:predicted site-specific integrase-resolvase
MQQLHKIAEAAKMLGVSKSALRAWDRSGAIKCIRTPGGYRLFDVNTIAPSDLHQQQAALTGATILYARVSSAKQRDDLERQRTFLRASVSDQHPGSIQEVSDIGSGINFKRPGLLRVLGLVQKGGVRQLVVASRDRLARFAFELIQWLCTENGTTIVVLDDQDGAPEDELGKDLMAIVQVYCCRWNGKRRYTKRGSKADAAEESEAAPSPDAGAEANVGEDGGVLQVHIQQGGGAEAGGGEHAQEQVRASGPAGDASQEIATTIKRRGPGRPRKTTAAQREQLLQQQTMAA